MYAFVPWQDRGKPRGLRMRSLSVPPALSPWPVDMHVPGGWISAGGPLAAVALGAKMPCYGPWTRPRSKAFPFTWQVGLTYLVCRAYHCSRRNAGDHGEFRSVVDSHSCDSLRHAYGMGLASQRLLRVI
mgnify:CR=1 FL=1